MQCNFMSYVRKVGRFIRPHRWFLKVAPSDPCQLSAVATLKDGFVLKGTCIKKHGPKCCLLLPTLVVNVDPTCRHFSQCHVYIRVAQKHEWSIINMRPCYRQQHSSCFMYVMSHAHVMSCYMSQHIACMNITQVCERKWQKRISTLN